MNKILQVKNISKTYNTLNGEIEALKDISIDINEGDFTAIIGSSGCGKSTLFNIIIGLENKDNGIIKKNDNLKIGYMLQEDALLPYLTIFENAMIGLKIQKKDNDENKKYVLNLLKEYGLIEFINKYPKELSGGMKQRVALIRTLATRPDLLLLDEPFSALDYQSRIKVADDVYNIIKKEKKTAIMITHDIGEAISLSQVIYVFSKRPAVVKKKYNIKLPNNINSIEKRKCPEFANYYEKIWSDLDETI
ncbi:MAG: ABC transporter ATP-binding protein [Bacilli bacterium]|nr:ABC transporter ATP-binding protein [Bacilli bacterium]